MTEPIERLSVLRNAPPWLDRVLSLVAGGLLLFGAIVWGDRALDLRDPCRAVRDVSLAVCNEPPAYLQTLQFVLAIVGIALTVVLAAMTLYQVASGRRVSWLRTLAAALAVVAVAWLVVFLIGWLSF